MSFESCNSIKTKAFPEVSVRNLDCRSYTLDFCALKETPKKDPTCKRPGSLQRRDSLNWEEELKHGLPSSSTIHREQLPRHETVDRPTDEIGSILKEMQNGIRRSIEKLKPPDRDLLMTDFSKVVAIHFKPRNRRGYTLLVFAPVAFRFCRDVFCITTEEFLASVCFGQLHETANSGRSGSRFFTTSDDKFILKIVPKKEALFLIDLFPGYFLNLTQHTKTLLPKYYGLYCYQQGTRIVRVLIMNNILPRLYSFHEKYDLKGSTYSKRKYRGKYTCPDHTLKDLDFIQRMPDGLYVQQHLYSTLLKSIDRDCQVLQSHGIMDYSLLLGILLPPTDSRQEIPIFEENFIGPFEARTGKGQKVYLFLGIIDILQSFTWVKRIESCLKSVFYSNHTISVIPPDAYARRFQEFLKHRVFKCVPKLISCSKNEDSIERQRLC